LKNKKIIVGITGSIAAYKAAFLVRLLVKAGATVQVIMTEAATDFITPLTLATLSKNPVLMDYQENKRSGEWNNHVELGLWADLLLIAPCSANTLAKLANGLCDNLLMAVYLSARCPVMVAPAMDLDMYVHPATMKNLATLASFPKHFIIEAASGELASGLSGQGRMEEPEIILEKVIEKFKNSFA
jgi:phosphopantothenoylcysteine decarboxylase/phosphopantothenate--cysteine ligase